MIGRRANRSRISRAVAGRRPAIAIHVVRRRSGHAAIALLMAIATGIFFTAGCHAPQPGEAEFTDAIHRLMSDHSRVTNGNSPKARRMAEAFESRLTERDPALAYGGRGVVAAADSAPRIWCELHGNQAAFIVHIPYLKMYGTELTNALLDQAWAAALAATHSENADHALELAVMLHGQDVNGGLAFGLAGGAPHKERGNVALDQRIFKYFMSSAALAQR